MLLARIAEWSKPLLVRENNPKGPRFGVGNLKKESLLGLTKAHVARILLYLELKF